MQDTDDILPEEEARPGRGPMLLVLLVIVATTLAVWLVPEQAPEPEPEPTPAAPPPAAQGAVPRADRPAAPSPVAAPVAAAARPGERARELIAILRSDSEHPGEAAFEEAQLHQQGGRHEDAYLLYFFAARRGHAGAALALGTLADPAHFRADNGVLDQADPAQAYKWYRMAAERGNSEASSRLTALQENLQAAARSGDQQAGRLLLQWH